MCTNNTFPRTGASSRRRRRSGTLPSYISIAERTPDLTAYYSREASNNQACRPAFGPDLAGIDDELMSGPILTVAGR